MSNTPTTSPIIDLSQARVPETPSEMFRNLATACEDLGINSFDVYGDFTLNAETSWLRRFEREVATYLGKEDAMFLPSGVMAQCLMLKAVQEARGLIDEQPEFICHYSSHLLLHEQNSYQHLLHLKPCVIPKDTTKLVQSPVNCADVQNAWNQSSNAITTILETPHREIGGKCTPIEEIAAIAAFCREKGMHFHLDGARLWEASGYYDNVKELCSHFDTLYVSFYKGLGAVTGAMLLGDTAFMDRCRVWLRRFGGNVYSLLPYAVSCFSKFRENHNSFISRKLRLQTVIAKITEHLHSIDSTENTQLASLVRFDPEVPQVCLVHAFFSCTSQHFFTAREKCLNKHGSQVSSRIRTYSDKECYFEFNLGVVNGNYSDEIWCKVYADFLRELAIVINEH